MYKRQGPFSASDYSSAYSTVLNATEAGHVYSNSPQGDYSWGTLAAPSYSSGLANTTYTWTPATTLTGTDVLMVAGGGGGGGHIAGGGGAGGLLHHTNQTLTGQKTIVVGGGGHGGSSSPTRIVAGEGKDTKFTGLSDAIGGGAASAYNPDSPGTVGGSGVVVVTLRLVVLVHRDKVTRVVILLIIVTPVVVVVLAVPVLMVKVVLVVPV